MRGGGNVLQQTNNLMGVSSLSEKVYQVLQREILMGDITSGERIIVLDIARRFDISQAPVREALERLKQEGLIIGKPNKGSVVTDITIKEVRDVYVLRELVEGYALRESMKNFTETDFGYLEEIIINMETVDKSSFQLVELDMQFHGYFYERSNNHVLINIWKNIRTIIMRFIATTNKDMSKEIIVRGHREILKLLKDGDVQEAEGKLIRGIQFYKNYTG